MPFYMLYFYTGVQKLLSYLPENCVIFLMFCSGIITFSIAIFTNSFNTYVLLLSWTFWKVYIIIKSWFLTLIE